MEIYNNDEIILEDFDLYVGSSPRSNLHTYGGNGGGGVISIDVSLPENV